jgi:hypothetical protein
MPTWGSILREIKAQQPAKGLSAFDLVRRKYIERLHKQTGRNVILYATKWTQPVAGPPEAISITDEDVHGLMEVVHGLRGPRLDLILHSPGGSAESAEAMVDYLRSKFDDIRVIVPHAAMSAATMIACSADRILMGKHSSLGPIDPQMILETPLGPTAVPAQAILDQFKMAQEQCKDPAMLGSWLPMLGQYGPALLVECQEALELSQQLVGEWLSDYMFSQLEDGPSRAVAVAAALANHSAFKSHGRHISREKARKLGGQGLIIDDLETKQAFQDAVLSVYHATAHTFNSTNGVKLIENHLGRAFVRSIQLIYVDERQGRPVGPVGTNPPIREPMREEE